MAATTAPAPRGLEIYWVDVEGGGATLVVTPARESVLIDTGFPGDRDALRIHRVATQAAGLTRIDHVVVTHFHIDHFGGLASLSRLMPIGTLHERYLASAPESRRSRSSRPTRRSRWGSARPSSRGGCFGSRKRRALRRCASSSWARAVSS